MKSKKLKKETDEEIVHSRAKHEVVVVLPDIRSSYNIGSIFRTSDATGVSKIYLCGYSPCPADKFDRPQKEIAKTALGAEKTIPWEYRKDIKKVIKDLKKDGFTIVAIEQDERSISYKEFFKKSGGKKVAKVAKVAIIFGNEVEGLSKKIIASCDAVVDIPMLGEKESLNVSVSAGIVLYELI